MKLIFLINETNRKSVDGIVRVNSFDETKVVLIDG